ncbi:MAG: hypothetical protein KDC38_07260, partial [Planctomycetes bacterium]|nr:hypothetical protein [Planctomycetota bacterium]
EADERLAQIIEHIELLPAAVGEKESLVGTARVAFDVVANKTEERSARVAELTAEYEHLDQEYRALRDRR